MAEVHFLISGRVQHVGFRRFVARHAVSLGITGFVRNRIDGSVEIYASSSHDLLNKFIQFCQKGPIFATVTEVTVLPVDDNLKRMIDNATFKILPTE
ncbi:MAG: acylphosphatase [Alphaproteobacteria bacterium]|nr:acylphosphatase [Alphaproteobacteria bacterium]